MADNQGAAASLPPVDKEVSPPLPVVHVLAAPVDDKVVKQRDVLVHVEDVKKPASSSLSISPSLAVKPPSDNNNNNRTTTTTTAPVAVPIRLMVCVWALINAVVFGAANVAVLILNRTPCNKSTWLFRCVTLTHAAAAEMSLLLYGELLYSAVAALAALLHMLLTATTSRRWGAIVEALAWVALATTAGMHCMEVASDRIFLAAKPGDTYIFADVVCGSVLLAIDLLAGVLFCCSPSRLELGEQQRHDDGEV